MWRRHWLVFSQAVTVALGVVFVLGTLKPEWLPHALGGPAPRPAPTYATPASTPAPAETVASATPPDTPSALQRPRAAPRRRW